MGIWTWIGIGVGAKIISDINRKNRAEEARASYELEQLEKKWKIEAEERQIISEKKKEAEEVRRSCSFILYPPFSEMVFFNTALGVCKRIKRIKDIVIVGPVVECVVTSQSGITDWSFSIDFNDYGDLTGRYWIYNENYDSQIPERVAEMIVEELEKISPLRPANITMDFDEKNYKITKKDYKEIQRKNRERNNNKYQNEEGLSLGEFLFVILIFIVALGICYFVFS